MKVVGRDEQSSQGIDGISWSVYSDKLCLCGSAGMSSVGIYYVFVGKFSLSFQKGLSGTKDQKETLAFVTMFLGSKLAMPKAYLNFITLSPQSPNSCASQPRS